MTKSDSDAPLASVRENVYGKMFLKNDFICARKRVRYTTVF